MRLSTTFKDPVLLLEQHLLNSRKILKESCDGLTLDQRIVVEGIYQDFIPLIEATLTAAQIKDVFASVEKAAIASGQSRTAIGHGVDAVKEANKTLNKIGAWLQDTKPVKAFDQKFENLKEKVSQKFPSIADKLEGLGELAKANPGKTAAVVGILTAMAALAGGPVGGAVAGQILRGSVELLKGEKLSTAVGKGIKTAVFGYLTGAALEKVGEMLSGVVAKFVPVPDNPNLVRAQFQYSEQLGNTNVAKSIQGTMLKPDADAMSDLADIFNTATDPADKAEAWAQYVSLVDKVATPEYRQEMIQMGVNAQQTALDNSALYQATQDATQAISAAAQGAAQTAGMPGDQKESYYVQTRPLSEGQVYLVFDRVVNEGELLDKIKKAGGAALGAVAKGASWVGKQATEEITSAKLLANWKMSGSPTDSEELKQFLIDSGVGADIVDQVYADMKIASGVDNTNLIQQISADFEQLSNNERQELVKYLQTQLGTV